MWYGFFCALVLVWGTCIGSFLNACIYRIPNGLSVVHPRSFCPMCHMKIAWCDNFPVLSWLVLRGRCRCCRTFIPPRYLLVEIVVGIMFLLVWLKYDVVAGPRVLGLDPITDGGLVPVYGLVIAGLVLGSFVDIEHLIIPDRVTIGGIICGLALSPLVPQLHGTDNAWVGLLQSGIGAGFGVGLLWAVAFIGKQIFKKEAMGFGDVKLMGAIGAFLGWRAVLFSVVVSSFLGSFVGIGLVIFGKREMQSRIPYGPYLALSALVWVYWGPALWDLYIRLILPSAELL